ncbi:MAG: hypothetical protein WC802_01125 [Patescibacteria group bacterium]|jgi:hypothetical protein
MTENIIFSLEDLFEEVVSAGVEQGINEESAYFDLVDEVIEEHREIGELHDDQGLDAHADVLKARFAEYMKRLEAQG